MKSGNGICECGCEQRTNQLTEAKNGYKKGDFYRFVLNHRKHISVTERLWDKIEKRGSDECWLWKAKSFANYGYGRLEVNGKPVRAHRLVYEETYGPIPENLMVRHTCDNPLCCNPKHLILGTQTDNMRDMLERGRYGIRNLPKGTKHYRAKINVKIVRKIRQMATKGYGPTAIIRELGLPLSKAAVSAIILRKSWKSVTDS